jgi:hypothetical protein
MEPRELSEDEIAKKALAIQDASNLAGVAWSMPVVQRGKHPALVLFLNKISTLAGLDCGCIGSQDHFSKAYAACRKLAGDPVSHGQ